MLCKRFSECLLRAHVTVSVYSLWCTISLPRAETVSRLQRFVFLLYWKSPLTYICSDIVNGEHLAFEMLSNKLSIISICTAESLSHCFQTHRHRRCDRTGPRPAAVASHQSSCASAPVTQRRPRVHFRKSRFERL